LEKAIEIKRRAQRFVQSGDLDGALSEYLKLAKAEENDPYHSVVVADLLYKKGDAAGASQRYLMAIDGYEKTGLYKNGIAVCKKMGRLGLSPGMVLKRLADLHEMDGLATEAALYHMQHAEHSLRSGDSATAMLALRKAFDATGDNMAALEKLAELHLANGDTDTCVKTLVETAGHYEKSGQVDAAERCRARALQLDPNAFTPPPIPDSTPPSDAADEATAVVAESDLDPVPPGLAFEGPAAAPPAPRPQDPADPLAALIEDSAGQDAIVALVTEARTHHLLGDLETATDLLVRAARACDDAGRHDPAAKFYRTISRWLTPSPHVLALWLRNCELRSDRTEAARVTCDLGEAAWIAGRADEAVNWFERARAFDASNELAERRLQTIASHREQAAERGTSGAERGASDDPSLEIGPLLERFRQEVQRQVSGDAESQYALGVSYLEMGLADQALESLRTASEHPAVRARAVELIGRCLMDQGRFDEAALELITALDQPTIREDAARGLRFELGLALEAAGRLDEALAEFERIYEDQPSYPDVALKIRVLRKTLEAH
jgi:tetratricopeptide (TPR) repeat protein